jgi:hypothetical protein
MRGKERGGDSRSVKLLLVLASTVTLASGLVETFDEILFSLLDTHVGRIRSRYISSGRTEQKTPPPIVPLLSAWRGVTCSVVASLFVWRRTA